MVVLAVLLAARPSAAQSATVSGTARDETGGALPGVTVELRAAPARPG